MFVLDREKRTENNNIKTKMTIEQAHEKSTEVLLIDSDGTLNDHTLCKTTNDAQQRQALWEYALQLWFTHKKNGKAIIFSNSNVEWVNAMLCNFNAPIVKSLPVISAQTHLNDIKPSQNAFSQATELTKNWYGTNNVFMYFIDDLIINVNAARQRDWSVRLHIPNSSHPVRHIRAFLFTI